MSAYNVIRGRATPLQRVRQRYFKPLQARFRFRDGRFLQGAGWDEGSLT